MRCERDVGDALALEPLSRALAIMSSEMSVPTTSPPGCNRGRGPKCHEPGPARHIQHALARRQLRHRRAMPFAPARAGLPDAHSGARPCPSRIAALASVVWRPCRSRRSSPRYTWTHCWPDAMTGSLKVFAGTPSGTNAGSVCFGKESARSGRPVRGAACRSPLRRHPFLRRVHAPLGDPLLSAGDAGHAPLSGAEAVIPFHIATAGRCWLSWGKVAPIPFEAGDVVVFARGAQHVLASEPGVTPVPIKDIYRPSAEQITILQHGGGGEESRFVCGFLHSDQRFGPLLDAMPALTCVRVRDGALLLEAFTDTGQVCRSHHRSPKTRNGGRRPSPILSARRPSPAPATAPCWRAFRSCCSWRSCAGS